MIYQEIHRLKKMGFSKSQIAKKLKISRNRVIDYSDLIRMQENAFQYFGGMTEEIVYDQDRLLAVSENAGELMLTEFLTKYHETRGFKIYLCRKSDPESKGKVEQLIKYVRIISQVIVFSKT